MARKTIPVQPLRERSRDDESLLLKSAESLGRIIGSLQRQLEAATAHVTSNVDGHARDGAARGRTKPAKKLSGARKATARKAAKKR